MSMKSVPAFLVLSAFVAEKRNRIYEDLKAGSPPSEGEYSEGLFKEANSKGSPQMGTTRFEPKSIVLEFIYPDQGGAASVLTVRINTPERILFMPVPAWVIESIWQGEIDGSYHFETEAAELLAAYALLLEAETNDKWFGPRPAKRRE